MQEYAQVAESSTINSKNITLYWMSGQIASWKIRIALEEKHLQGYKSIMIIRSEHIDKNDEFWKDNEYGTIPSLKIQDISLNGVLPILLFLETSQSTLLPASSAEEKALMFQRAFESLEFQRACSEDLINYYLSFNNFQSSNIDRDLREKREKILFYELIRWNDYVSQNSINNVGHASVTLVDILFFPELALAVRFGLSLDYFSSLHNYYGTLSKRPSICKTWPYHWLHSTITYDCLSNITRFERFYRKQSESIESISHTLIDQDDKTELPTEFSEESNDITDDT